MSKQEQESQSVGKVTDYVKDRVVDEGAAQKQLSAISTTPTEAPAEVM